MNVYILMDTFPEEDDDDDEDDPGKIIGAYLTLAHAQREAEKQYPESIYWFPLKSINEREEHKNRAGWIGSTKSELQLSIASEEEADESAVFMILSIPVEQES